MKKIIFIAITLLPVKIFAQSAIEQIISAEKSFAETSKTAGTKKAFLSFADSECVGFNKGNEINIFDEWTTKKADSTKLYWQPELTVAAVSGDMGITTGPWQYYKNSLSDTPLAHGQFASVWQKKTDGKWKVFVDIGISFTEKTKEVSTSKKIVLSKQQYRLTYESELDKANDVFAYEFIKDKDAALNKYMDDDCFVLIEGHAPLKGSKAIKANAEIIPDGLRLKQSGNYFSGVKDLLAAYGTVTAGDKKMGYLCVWKRKGDNWKLLMLAISY